MNNILVMNEVVSKKTTTTSEMVFMSRAYTTITITKSNKIPSSIYMNLIR